MICVNTNCTPILLAEIGIVKPVSAQFPNPNTLYTLYHNKLLLGKNAILNVLFFCLYWFKLLYLENTISQINHINLISIKETQNKLERI